MSNASASPHPFGPLLAVHGELMEDVAELRRWWHEVEQLGIPRFGEMGTRLQRLRDVLQAHFETEEAGGYLAAALAIAPRFTEQARTLREQHQQLLASLDRLMAKLTALEPPFRSWGETWTEFDSFLRHLQQHEEAENDLIQAAFNQDASAID